MIGTYEERKMINIYDHLDTALGHQLNARLDQKHYVYGNLMSNFLFLEFPTYQFHFRPMNEFSLIRESISFFLTHGSHL